MKRWATSTAIAALLLCLAGIAPGTLYAEVTRVEITSRSDVDGSRAFGDAGPYERLEGKIYFSLDPINARNEVIVDLDNSPQNAKGEVEFSSDLVVLRPKDPARGNQVVYFDVVNRGRLGLPNVFNGRGGQGDSEFGEAFLMTRGYTIVAVGWEFNPRGTVALYPPIATKDGKPITGSITGWWIPSAADPSFDVFSSYWTGFKVYPPRDPFAAEYRLTERYGFFGEPKLIPRDMWRFGREYGGSFVVDPQYVTIKGGFKPGYTYELTYETKDPRVAGTGYAALRDAASYFKFNPASEVKARYAYAYGGSQAGRFLRAFIREGFTIDERERQAFDAIWVQVGGASLGSFNEPFVQPNEGGFYTTTWFPFLYETTTDPATGERGGLGARIPEGKHPNVFLVDSSNEYWDRGRVSALNHLSLDGKRDVEPPSNVRIYHVAGTPHGFSGTFPPRPSPGTQLPNTIVVGKPVQRALMIALDNWVQKDESPPPSRYARLSNGTLVAQKDIKFPDIPGVRFPYDVHGGYRSDRPGPLTSHPVPFFVPQVDSDGNERAGILMPEVSVPLSTNTGWAFRSEDVGAPDQVAFLSGSYIPFAPTRAAREQRGDPRPSVEERYTGRVDYMQRVTSAARGLVSDGYMMAEDVDEVVDRAGQHWDLIMRAASPNTQDRPAGGQKAEVLRAEQQRFAAMMAADAAALDGLLGAELSYVDSSGAVEDRAAFLDHVKSGRPVSRTMCGHSTKSWRCLAKGDECQTRPKWKRWQERCLRSLILTVRS